MQSQVVARVAIGLICHTPQVSQALSANRPISANHPRAGKIDPMNFAFTEEQEELRKTVRAFLDAKSSEAAVREQMETVNGLSLIHI